MLLVDDNKDAADLLDSAVSNMGHTTLTVGDGPSALEGAERFRPDVALIDIGLPVMDGYEVALQMRALLREETPVLIAVTGYGQASDLVRSHAAGFDHHLVKPIDLARFEEIFALIARPARSVR